MERLRSAARTVTVEPAYFGYSLSVGLYAIVVRELYIAKVCNVNLGLGHDLCDEIQQHKEEQAAVQRQVATLRIYNTLLRALPMVLFALFAGPWSDRFGRKPLIVISVLGFCLSNLVFLLNVFFFDELRAEYLLFEVLQACTGSGVVFFMACNAYMADVTDPEHRTKRVAFMSGLNPVGFNLGKALSGVINTNLGFKYNAVVGMAVSVATALYVVFLVPDSIRIREERLKRDQVELEEKVQTEDEVENLTVGQKFRRLFDFQNLKDGVR